MPTHTQAKGTKQKGQLPIQQNPKSKNEVKANIDIPCTLRLSPYRRMIKESKERYAYFQVADSTLQGKAMFMA